MSHTLSAQGQTPLQNLVWCYVGIWSGDTWQAKIVKFGLVLCETIPRRVKGKGERGTPPLTQRPYHQPLISLNTLELGMPSSFAIARPLKPRVLNLATSSRYALIFIGRPSLTPFRLALAKPARMFSVAALPDRTPRSHRARRLTPWPGHLEVSKPGGWNIQSDLPADKFPENCQEVQRKDRQSPFRLEARMISTLPARTARTSKPGSLMTLISSSPHPLLTAYSQSELSAAGA